MSSGAAAARPNLKGKQVETIPTDVERPPFYGDHEHPQRDYHQRMVEHVRNTAIVSLNTNPFHPPVLSSPVVSSNYVLTGGEHTHGTDYRPYQHHNSRSDTNSTTTSLSLSSPGRPFESSDSAQMALDSFNPFPRSTLGGVANPADRYMPAGVFNQPIERMAKNQDFGYLLNTSEFNGVYPYNVGAPDASRLIDLVADRNTDGDHSLGFGLDVSAQGHPHLYPTFDATSYPYSIPGSSAFGYTGMYTAAPFEKPASLPNERSSIDPGYLHAPAYMDTTSSRGSRASADELDSQGRQDMWEFPASPLHSVSPSPSPIEAVHNNTSVRRNSDSVLPDGPDGRGKRGHKRKMTWSSGMASEGPNVSKAQKEQELLELERLEQGGAATRRERRRLQNRLAQRAFRARSKLQNNATATHMIDLEELADVQAEQLSHMQVAMDKLQAENLQLRTDRWNQVKSTGPVARSGASARQYSTNKHHNSSGTKV